MECYPQVKKKSLTPKTGGRKVVEPNKAKEENSPGVATYEKILELRALATLCNVLAVTEMAEIMKEAIELAEVSELLEAQKYKVLITMGLSGFPKKVVNAFLDTRAGPNLIRKIVLLVLLG